MELKGNHNALEGTHEPKTQNRRQGHPNHQMHPNGRMQGELGKEHCKGNDKADDQDHEHGRPVATVRFAKVETAGLAPLANL
mgnify:CR=1 FL=1